jgi:hypothetical protein
MFGFHCARCGEWHEGMPDLIAEAPLYYYGIPERERASRCTLTRDTCVVDGKFFFARGNIEIPVLGTSERFAWGSWVSLSERNFGEYVRALASPDRKRLGPYFGWLSASFRGYPESENLKTMFHPREDGSTPYIELEPTDHPLAVEQRNGISQDRLAEIYVAHVHSQER